MITPAQSKAARGLLDWSQADLARHAGLGESTVRDFEKGRRVPSYESLQTLKETLELAGVSFIENAKQSQFGGEGVRYRNSDIRRSEESRMIVAKELINYLTSEKLVIDHKLQRAFEKPIGTVEIEKLALLSISGSIDKLINEALSEYQAATSALGIAEDPIEDQPSADEIF